MAQQPFKNPFRPGAGQQPPYLAGRKTEQDDFELLLGQDPILKNLIISGLRGVGKTVLLESLKPIAIKRGWFWAGTDLSESASVSERTLSIRILTDLSALVSPFTVQEIEKRSIGFNTQAEKTEVKLTYNVLYEIYNQTPGLESDKIKRVLEVVWETIKDKAKGIVFAYDEAQNLKDKASEKQYPLSVLLEVMQHMQRKEIPYILVLTGLPTLFPNLVEARTYAERMFHNIILTRLRDDESKEAIVNPIRNDKCPVTFMPDTISKIIEVSGGYPYFIQFFCKEAFDSYILQKSVGIDDPLVTLTEVLRKLDIDFYSGRWSKITDRQKDLLELAAKLPNADAEFSIQNLVTESNRLPEDRKFKASHVNQILNKLIDLGLIFKSRHGEYSFAVPMLGDYIRRQSNERDKKQTVDVPRTT